MKHVLVVDDDIRIRTLLRAELEEDGYAVSTVSNGKQAFSIIMSEQRKPDLVILDLRMPRMDGLDTLGHILKLKFYLPVIIYTAYNGYRKDPLVFGADAYVVKSSDVSELKAVVRRLACELERTASSL